MISDHKKDNLPILNKKEEKEIKEDQHLKMIKEIMDIIEVSNENEIIPSLKRIKELVEKVPQMNNYISEVCEIVSGSKENNYNILSILDSLKKMKGSSDDFLQSKIINLIDSYKIKKEGEEIIQILKNIFESNCKLQEEYNYINKKLNIKSASYFKKYKLFAKEFRKFINEVKTYFNLPKDLPRKNVLEFIMEKATHNSINSNYEKEQNGQNK